MKPFRWNIKKVEQLGSLKSGERSSAYKGFIKDLRKCSARIIAFSHDSELFFIGRSPESIFDYLSGVFEGTTWESKIHHLNISNRFRDVEEIKSDMPKAYQSLKEHFRLVGVSPKQIIHRKVSTCFVDLVAEGGTFGNILNFFINWCAETNFDLPSLRNKLRFIGITIRTKTSPKTWRWQQKVDWVKQHNIKGIMNVSIPDSLWRYLGNWQLKVSKTNPPELWHSEEILLPPREEDNIKALRRAYGLYERGKTEHSLFSDLLVKEPSMHEYWYRRLVTELRKIT